MRDEYPTLVPARAVDLHAHRETFLRDAPLWMKESPLDLAKAVTGRTMDALTPLLPALARRIRDGGVPDGGGVAVRHVTFPSPWHLAFSLERDGSPGILFLARLRVPFDKSPSLVAARERREGAIRAAVIAEGHPEEEIEFEVISRSFAAEFREEEGFEVGGLPADLPDPEGFTRVESVSVALFAAPMEPRGPDEDFATFAARARPSVGTGLDGTVRSLAADAYHPDMILNHRESRPDEGDGRTTWSTNSGSDLRDPTAWLDAFGRLAAVLPDDVRADLASRAREIGERAYETHSDPGYDRALEEVGAALAYRAAGLPGAGTLSWMRDFERRLLSDRCNGMPIMLSEISDGVAALGEDRLTHNDLDDSLSVTDLPDGSLALTASCQSSQFVVLIGRDAGGGISRISAARYGLPLEGYLSGPYAGEDVERMGYTEFHRRNANPRDTESALDRAGALSALREGRDAFPGLLARFEVEDGTVRCVATGAYDTVTIRDTNGLLTTLEGALLAVREDLDAKGSPSP